MQNISLFFIYGNKHRDKREVVKRIKELRKEYDVTKKPAADHAPFRYVQI